MHPKIEVEIDTTDKSPFFIRPHHVMEEDKNFIMRKIMLFKILMDSFFGLF